MSTTSSLITFDSIVSLWQTGKSPKEIGALIGVSGPQVSSFICTGRTIFGESVFPTYLRNKLPTNKKDGKPRRSRKPAAFWRQIARMWRRGKTGPEIALAMEGSTSLTRGNSLVDQARRHLGAKAVPSRLGGLKVEIQPKTPITMKEFGRHYLRKVGDEWIFRNESGTEEVWVETLEPTGLLYRSRGNRPPRRLAFKNNLGIG